MTLSDDWRKAEVFSAFMFLVFAAFLRHDIPDPRTGKADLAFMAVCFAGAQLSALLLTIEANRRLTHLLHASIQGMAELERRCREDPPEDDG